MFGRRKRERAAEAEAARETERRALFAKLAERPETICPFLGLSDDRTGYIDGVSVEHRCYAFGEPAPLSAEQQTRVCQERGYGNCPRYLRGVLVIPTEELEALRRPRAATELPGPPLVAKPERRRRAPLLALVAFLLLVGVGGAAAYLLFGRDPGVAVDPTPTPTPTAEPTASPEPSPSVSATIAPSPTVPLNAITRGELARLMADALGLPPAVGDYYTDDEASEYEADINRLAEAGVTIGCSENAFCPDANASRAELASFVSRALSLPDASRDYFSDDTGSLHESDINRLAEAGITEGCGSGRYCPNDTVTREEPELSRIVQAAPSP